MALPAEINFADPATINCPYSAYRYLLAERPIHFDMGTGAYIATRYEDVRAILRDPKLYSSEGYLNQLADTMLSDRAERLRELFRTRGWLPGPALGFIDDPRHAEVRAIFDSAFRASRVRAMEPELEAIAYELVDSVAATGRCDFVDAVAIPLPLRVTGLITCIPPEDLGKIRLWTDAFIRRFGLMIGEEEERACVELEIEAQHYLKAIIDRLRTAPDDTLLSDIVNTRMTDGSTLDDNALFAHLMADTFVGGSETTTSALASGIRMMCEDAALQARLRADPQGLLRGFVEEVLRLESPVQGLFRVSTADVTLQGVAIPAGSVINVRFAAANRDERQFSMPEALDPGRRNAGAHMAFGSGVHHCVGATLARRELYWGFRAVLERWGDIRLAPGEHSVELAPSLMLRRLARLDVVFEDRR